MDGMGERTEWMNRTSDELDEKNKNRTFQVVVVARRNGVNTIAICYYYTDDGLWGPSAGPLKAIKGAK